MTRLLTPLFVRRLCALALVLPLAAPLAAQTPAVPGLDAAGMDRSVLPGDDFYRYANGTWLREIEIPADRSAYGSFNTAAALADAEVSALVREAAAAGAPAGSDLRRIGDYYTALIDTTAIEEAGLSPLRPLLAQIEAIDSRTALARFLGATLRADVDVINDGSLHTDNLFGLWVDQDFDQPTRNSAALLQGGLAMPDRSYYLDPSPAMVEIRTAYRAHVAAMLGLAGIPDPSAKADSVLALETRIAQAHWEREDTWDVVKGNTHWSRADLAARAPGLDWDTFFEAAGLGGLDTLVAWQPSAITGLSALVASAPLASWKALLAYHAAEHRAAVLPAAFGREAFAFFGRTLSGTPQQGPREARAVSATSAALGFAVGRQYVERAFSAGAKARAEAMVAGIVAAFDARIEALGWMAPETKAEARRKLQTLRVSVGYPDVWPGYAGLDVDARDAYGNAERVERFEYAQALATLAQPVDRDAWSMTPQMVNAVNMPAMNALNFPAAILQPPFFDPDRSDAMNYAAIGAVIGHEISHSFDNLGANFDADGRLRNWWTAEDLAHFTASTDALARQYDAYHPFPDLAVNGGLTLTENIADLAGLAAAYDAWRASLGGREAPVVGGLTGDQQFFLSFAQVWRTAYRDAALRQRLLTDGHAPGPYRALTVRNLDAWVDAFAVEPGQALFLAPEERVRIW
ncbi:MAG TPA: M13 family metallopeptidase [Rubricoccaceae bacterium]|jgi:predicted metalloendopeptidase